MRLTRVVTLVCCALMVIPLGPVGPASGSSENRETARARKQPPLTATARDALSNALNRGRISESQYALARARSLFQLKKVRREFGQVARPDPHQATFILRDLALRSASLTGDEAAQARALLARPDDDSDPSFDEFGLATYSGATVTTCSPNREYCLHWADPSDSDHAPDQTDGNSNGRPDFVDNTITTMDTVWDKMEELGFRRPKSDANSKNKGPDHRTDIYLANIGSAGIYGYCSTDDPNARRAGSPQYPYFDFSAYCVLDDDYSLQEFPSGTPLSNLQVTAAHEFFHAIQFAYDGAEDGWLMEGTATAMEDVVFDAIDDNHQFLLDSQLIQPALPLDYSHYDFGHPQFGLRYGAWLFWRFMTEELAGGPPGRNDEVIREIWERVDASPQAAFNDEWSLKAAKKVSKRYHGVGFKKLFSEWGVGLLLPSARFEEGEAYSNFLESRTGRRGAPMTRSFLLDEDSGSGWFSKRIDHLASRYYRFLPGSGVGPDDHLKVKVDGPAKRRGASATLVSVTGGQLTVRRMSLNKKGIGTIRVAFPDAAYLILQNASTRISDCYQYPPFTSCMGLPRDDRLRFKAKGRAIGG